MVPPVAPFVGMSDIAQGYYRPEKGNRAWESNPGPAKSLCCEVKGSNHGPAKYCVYDEHKNMCGMPGQCPHVMCLLDDGQQPDQKTMARPTKKQMMVRPFKK